MAENMKLYQRNKEQKRAYRDFTKACQGYITHSSTTTSRSTRRQRVYAENYGSHTAMETAIGELIETLR
eukprot:1697154-Amphidinium_carterae.1